MCGNELVGRQVNLRGPDPNLFGAPAAAVIRATDPTSRALLLEFMSPIQIGGNTYPFAVASPRLQCDDWKVLISSGRLPCAVTFVPRDRYDPEKPFDLSWWRGGGAALADLVL